VSVRGASRPSWQGRSGGRLPAAGARHARLARRPLKDGLRAPGVTQQQAPQPRRQSPPLPTALPPGIGMAPLAPAPALWPYR
jgi:hypothetical protein